MPGGHGKQGRVSFLLGASASKASQELVCEQNENVPPVGTNLLESLAHFDHVWQNIRQQVHEDGTDETNFELIMDQLARGRYDNALGRNWRNAAYATVARYFSRFQDIEGSVYDKLCAYLVGKQWTGTVFTLNYETLFLQAANRNDLSFQNPRIQTHPGRNTHDPYMSQRNQDSQGNRYLHYPHGASNLFEPGLYGSSALPGIQVNYAALLEQSRNSEHAIEVNQAAAQRLSQVPRLMASYDTEKTKPFPTQFLKAEQKAFENHLEERTDDDVVIILGCRAPQGNAFDEHIWEPLRRTTAKLVYCSGRNQAAAFNRWQTSLRPNMDDVAHPFAIQQYMYEILRAELGE